MTTVKHWMTMDGFICRFDAGDLPLLVAIAGTHSPHLSLGVVWHQQSTGLSLGLSILYPWRVSYLDRSVFGNGPLWTDCLFAEPRRWSYEDRPSIKGSLWVVWYRETFCLLSHSSGSITMWYEISCLLIQALFLSCV